MRAKILLIDDEVQLVNMVKMRLEANDFEVITADKGPDGLEKAKNEKPNLILLDILMPLMDGFEVLDKLKNTPETREIPVIMLTAKGEAASILKAQDSGADDYIIKPFDSGELLDLVKRYIRWRF